MFATELSRKEKKRKANFKHHSDSKTLNPLSRSNSQIGSPSKIDAWHHTFGNQFIQRQFSPTAQPGNPIQLKEQTSTKNKTIERDSEGRRLHSSGIWTDNDSLTVSGGQGMHFKLNNLNVLGTTIRITDHRDQSDARILLPLGTTDMYFAIFGAEPIGWKFDIRTESDVFLVGWKLFSTWIPGDPPNK